MKTMRAILTGLAATALLSAPGATGAAGAATPSAGAAPHLAQSLSRLAEAQRASSIRFLTFNHIRGANQYTTMIGQVVGEGAGQHGALAGAVVKVYRQLDGNSTWLYLGSTKTDDGAYPQFTYAVQARQNAHYKVTFAGDDTFAGSQGVTWLSVFRMFNGKMTDGPGAATLAGHVDPYYTHKTIWLQKRSCAACNYVTIKTTTTGVGGDYSFALPAPDSGRWWWRLAIPGTSAFIASFGATWTTQLI